MPDLIILCSSKALNKLGRLIDQPSDKEGKYLVITGDYAADVELRKKNIPHKKITEYSPPLEDIAERGINWLKAWYNTAILDNKNIKDLVTYDGVSSWWFMDYWLFNSSFYFSPPISEIIRYVETIDNMIRAEKPSKIITVGDTQIEKIVSAVCSARNVPLTVIRDNYLSIIRKQLMSYLRLETPASKLFLKWMRTLVRKAYWNLLKIDHGLEGKEKSEKASGKSILILSADYCVPVLNSNTMKIETGDPYLSSVIDELKKTTKDVITFVGVLRGYSVGLRVMKQQLQNDKLVYKPFDAYLNLGGVIRTVKALRKTRRKLKLLIDSQEFKKSLFYENIQLYELLRTRFAFFLTRFVFDIALHIEMTKDLISAEKPDIIVITEETVMDGRAITVAGKFKGIPVLSVQHGIVGSRGITDYDHNTGDFGPNREVTRPFCPIPDKIALYGDFYKRACVRVSKYPESILVVTGSPRYDFLVHAKEIFKKDDICRELSSIGNYRLDATKKIVALLTQPLPSVEERELVLNCMYKALKKLNGVQLVVKLHPGESNDSLHRRLLNEIGLENVIIVKNFDTYKLLFASDLVVAALSTTLLEATALEKPAILLDLFKRGYGSFLECKEAMLEVNTEDELVDAINVALFGVDYSRKAEKGRSVFRYDHLYRMDGQASRRVADLINEMVEAEKAT